MNPEIKGRLISFISKKFVFSGTVFAVATILLRLGYIEGSHWATVVTGGVFAFDISDALGKKYESYSDKVGPDKGA